MLLNGYSIKSFAKYYGKESVHGNICTEPTIYSYKDACARKKVLTTYLTPYEKNLGVRYLIVKVVDGKYKTKE